MRWVYLSPHFDDIALSCGGLAWEQVQAGQPVEIWTVCAGAPAPGEPVSDFAQSLHDRWQTGTEAVAVRRVEDEAAIASLGAQMRFWDLPDCIYRRLPGCAWLVNGEDDLWQPLHPQEEGVVESLSAWLQAGLQPGDRLVSPLTLGDHVDHRLVRAAVERAAGRVGTPVWYYADYPYAIRSSGEIAGRTGPGWQKECWTVSLDGLHAWQASIACYISQISTFWGGLEEMRSAIQAYWQSGGGTCLWWQPGFIQK
jgi:LmbE family N-acetylglucosaminyl deacetylase